MSDASTTTAGGGVNDSQHSLTTMPMISIEKIVAKKNLTSTSNQAIQTERKVVEKIPNNVLSDSIRLRPDLR
jgi:hypothetical protein